MVAREGRTQLLLRGGAAGAVAFVVVFLVDGATRPCYSPARHPVSALSHGSRGWVQVTSFVVTGLLMVAFATGLRRSWGPERAVWGPALIAVFGAGLVVSGTFAMDPSLGYPPGAPPGIPHEPSAEHQVHDLAGLAVFLSLPAAALVLAWRFRAPPGERAWAIYSAATGLAVLALFACFAVAWEQESSMAGVVQRATILVGWTWVSLLSLHVARPDPRPS